jgi:hypothetical protein
MQFDEEAAHFGLVGKTIHAGELADTERRRKYRPADS